jgi:uncharacterized protein YcbX
VDGRVARISIAPVKSLGLVRLEEVRLERGGVTGDRRFWLVDEDGRLMDDKRCGSLVRIRPEWDEATRWLALTLPRGERVEGVVELGELVAVELYGERLPSRPVVGPWAAAISRVAGRPLTLLWAEGGAVDRGLRGGTVSLVSRASLTRLAEEAGVATVDGRRFRMLFEIEGVGAHAEDEWLGSRVAIGDAVVAVAGDVGRCAVTTHDPDTGVPDLDTLGTLARYRSEGRVERLPFGVYGSVTVPGRVRLGDPVRPSQGALLTAT